MDAGLIILIVRIIIGIVGVVELVGHHVQGDVVADDVILLEVHVDRSIVKIGNVDVHSRTCGRGGKRRVKDTRIGFHAFDPVAGQSIGLDLLLLTHRAHHSVGVTAGHHELSIAVDGRIHRHDAAVRHPQQRHYVDGPPDRLALGELHIYNERGQVRHGESIGRTAISIQHRSIGPTPITEGHSGNITGSRLYRDLHLIALYHTGGIGVGGGGVGRHIAYKGAVHRQISGAGTCLSLHI